MNKCWLLAAISKEELEPKKDHHLIFWTQTTILEQQQQKREQKQRSAPHHNECSFSSLIMAFYSSMVGSSVASSMKNSSIERAQACSNMKFRARACSSIRKLCMIELLPGYLTENALFLPKFAYFQRLVCIEH